MNEYVIGTLLVFSNFLNAFNLIVVVVTKVPDKGTVFFLRKGFIFLYLTKFPILEERFSFSFVKV